MKHNSSNQLNNSRQSKINVGIAIAIGAGIGVAMKNLAIGITIGVAIYFALNRTKRIQKNKGESGCEDKS